MRLVGDLNAAHRHGPSPAHRRDEARLSAPERAPPTVLVKQAFTLHTEDIVVAAKRQREDGRGLLGAPVDTLAGHTAAVAKADYQLVETPVQRVTGRGEPHSATRRDGPVGVEHSGEQIAPLSPTAAQVVRGNVLAVENPQSRKHRLHAAPFEVTDVAKTQFRGSLTAVVTKRARRR